MEGARHDVQPRPGEGSGHHARPHALPLRRRLLLVRLGSGARILQRRRLGPQILVPHADAHRRGSLGACCRNHDGRIPPRSAQGRSVRVGEARRKGFRPLERLQQRRLRAVRRMRDSRRRRRQVADVLRARRNTDGRRRPRLSGLRGCVQVAPPHMGTPPPRLLPGRRTPRLFAQGIQTVRQPRLRTVRRRDLNSRQGPRRRILPQRKPRLCRRMAQVDRRSALALRLAVPSGARIAQRADAASWPPHRMP